MAHPLYSRARLLAYGARDRSRKLFLRIDLSLFTTAAMVDWLTRQPNCECCNLPFDLSFKFNGPSNLSPSLDRIVPDRGYVASNVALLCWRCNNLKRDATADELRRIADWLAVRTSIEDNVNA